MWPQTMKRQCLVSLSAAVLLDGFVGVCVEKCVFNLLRSKSFYERVRVEGGLWRDVKDDYYGFLYGSNMLASFDIRVFHKCYMQYR